MPIMLRTNKKARAIAHELLGTLRSKPKRLKVAKLEYADTIGTMDKQANDVMARLRNNKRVH
jgi:hypothetical protein